MTLLICEICNKPFQSIKWEEVKRLIPLMTKEINMICDRCGIKEHMDELEQALKRYKEEENDNEL